MAARGVRGEGDDLAVRRRRFARRFRGWLAGLSAVERMDISLIMSQRDTGPEDFKGYWHPTCATLAAVRNKRRELPFSRSSRGRGGARRVPGGDLFRGVFDGVYTMFEDEDIRASNGARCLPSATTSRVTTELFERSVL